MNASRMRLPMIAWIVALLTVASAWGATFTERPWNIVLIILAIIGISITIGTIGYWFSRTRLEMDAAEHEDDTA